MKARDWGRVLVLTAALATLPGCFGHVHTIGDGPQGGDVFTQKIWYAAWGFVPLQRVDSERLVGAARDYRIVTSFRASDVFLNLFCGPLGFFRLSSRVEK
ncbi:MAG: hypothetical protein AB7O52_14535 [Planctomycetota bacterium]